MLTVHCMNTNGHAPQSEVEILRRQVERYLSEPFEFNCITESDLPGWWGKIRLLSPQISRERNLWLDLDVTITGALDPLVTPLTAQLRIAKNWAQSGWGGCQSSVMYWEGNSAQIINDTFNRQDAHWPPRSDLYFSEGVPQYGDQEWITHLRNIGKLAVEHFDFAHVQSYKYHCRQGLPTDCRVVCFHGRPKPSEVYDEWVMNCRK